MSKASLIVECKYDSVLDFNEGMAGVILSDKINSYNETLKDRQCGFINKIGTETIPLIYSYTRSFLNNKSIVGVCGSNYNSIIQNLEHGCIDINGNVVIQFKYVYFYDFYDSIAVAYNGKNDSDHGWGCLDIFGNKIISFGKYESIGLSWFSTEERDWFFGLNRFYNGNAIVRIGNRVGFINNNGIEITPVKYDSAYCFNEGYAAVGLGEHKERKWGFLDNTGNEVISCKYDKVKSFSEGMAAVMKNSQWGFIDTTGREIIPCRYNNVEYFSDGLAVIWDGKKYGFIDKTGVEIVPCKYDGVLGCREFNKNWNGFIEGMAAVYNDGMWGFINTSGNEIIPCKYHGIGEDIDVFREGFVAIRPRPDWKWGFLDKSGNEVTGFIFDDVRSFSQGLASVRIGDYRNQKWGYINYNGDFEVPLEFDDARSYSEDMAAVKNNDKWGFINLPSKRVQ